MKNTLYYGNNLDVLRKYIKDETVDLTYLDPPFKSNRNYNVLFKEANGTESAAQIQVFTDTWRWNQTAEAYYEEICERCAPNLVELMNGMIHILGRNDVTAYLVNMAIRVVELHRDLKPTGSIYLHCDPTASHYLKLLLDAVFDKKNFRNEIIWHYRKWPSGNRQYQHNHDVIFFYSKSDSKERPFNIEYMERTASTLKRFGKETIVSGYDPQGRRIPSRTEKKESKGVPLDDVWNIGRVPPVKQLFPTQKPEALISRIIKTSSNPGNVVLDPFCGCGTTIVEAQRLKRKWIGIDVTPLAITLIRWRLRDAFGPVAYDVEGEPLDIPGARELARSDRHKFQWWALGLAEARPVDPEKKKGADKGVDGVKYFQDERAGKAKKVVVQVKSGAVHVKDIREFAQVVRRQGARIGYFITLEKPTREMLKEAASEGFYESPTWGRKFARIQLRTIGELLKGKAFDAPPPLPPFKKAGLPEPERTMKLPLN